MRLFFLFLLSLLAVEGLPANRRYLRRLDSQNRRRLAPCSGQNRKPSNPNCKREDFPHIVDSSDGSIDLDNEQDNNPSLPGGSSRSGRTQRRTSRSSSLDASLDWPPNVPSEDSIKIVGSQDSTRTNPNDSNLAKAIKKRKKQEKYWKRQAELARQNARMEPDLPEPSLPNDGMGPDLPPASLPRKKKRKPSLDRQYSDPQTAALGNHPNLNRKKKKRRDSLPGRMDPNDQAVGSLGHPATNPLLKKRKSTGSSLSGANEPGLPDSFGAEPALPASFGSSSNANKKKKRESMVDMDNYNPYVANDEQKARYDKQLRTVAGLQSVKDSLPGIVNGHLAKGNMHDKIENSMSSLKKQLQRKYSAKMDQMMGGQDDPGFQGDREYGQNVDPNNYWSQDSAGLSDRDDLRSQRSRGSSLFDDSPEKTLYQLNQEKAQQQKNIRDANYAMLPPAANSDSTDTGGGYGSDGTSMDLYRDADSLSSDGFYNYNPNNNNNAVANTNLDDTGSDMGSTPSLSAPSNSGDSIGNTPALSAGSNSGDSIGNTPALSAASNSGDSIGNNAAANNQNQDDASSMDSIDRLNAAMDAQSLPGSSTSSDGTASIVGDNFNTNQNDNDNEISMDSIDRLNAEMNAGPASVGSSQDTNSLYNDGSVR